MEIKTIKQIKQHAPQGIVNIPIADLRILWVTAMDKLGEKQLFAPNIAFTAIDKTQAVDFKHMYVVNNRGTAIAKGMLPQQYHANKRTKMSHAPTYAPARHYNLADDAEIMRDFVDRRFHELLHCHLYSIENYPMNEHADMLLGSNEDNLYFGENEPNARELAEIHEKIGQNLGHGTLTIDQVALLAKKNGIHFDKVDKQIIKLHEPETQRAIRAENIAREQLDTILN